MSKADALKRIVKDDLAFFKTWTQAPLKLGAVVPSSRAFARMMIACAEPDPNGYVLELGAGTGVVTQALLDHGHAPERIVSVEYDPEFFRLLRDRFPRVNVIHGDAFNLDGTLGAFRDTIFSAVLSGVPILMLPEQKRIAYIEDKLARVAPGGNMTQLSYAWTPPQPAVPGRFTVEKSPWVVKNLPPGRVWIYRKAG